MRKISLIIAICFLVNVSFSQDDAKEIAFDDNYSMVDKLDSLLIDWYKTYTIDANIRNFENNIEVNIADISDSVYIERLSKIVSPIPLTAHSLVLNYIKRYISKGKWFIPDLLGKAQYYFPMFEEILDTYQLPLELKYLTIVESALNPNAVSRAGATGI